MYDYKTPKGDSPMKPFTEKVPFNEWVEVSDSGVLNEDLAVWFGKKKKPKGSSQPKGPWVNICRKVDGKHPPCGRHDTFKGSYPKCRAAGVAGKMSDSAKKSACAQKRAAEKKDPQTGKGQKPVMTSYNPKKKTNEQMSRIIKLTESDLKRIITRVLKENEDPITIAEGQTINLTCKHLQTGKTNANLDATTLLNWSLYQLTGNVKYLKNAGAQYAKGLDDQIKKNIELHNSI
jgi:hypothetical protein